jgi:phosphohistidine phosphatase SixA
MKNKINNLKIAPLLAITVVLGLLGACTQPDTTKPTVELNVVGNVAAVGALALTATANDNLAVTKVEFYRGGTKISEDSSAPYEASINITSADNGKLMLSAKAYDAAGNIGVSAVKEIIVSILVVKPNKDLLLPTGLNQEFRASEPVTWSVTEASGGEISAAGVYKAPIIAGDYTIRATSVASGGTVDTKIKVIASSSSSTVSLDSLKNGGYNIFFRHAEASAPGSGSDTSTAVDPMWWKSCDTKLARQLDDKGRGDAKKIGMTIKSLNIPIERFISSEFCRNVQTAEIINESLNLPATQLQQNAVLNCCGAPGTDLAAIDQLVATLPKAGQNLAFVAHATTSPLSNTLNRGDAAILEPLGDGLVRFVGYIRLVDWTKIQ